MALTLIRTSPLRRSGIGRSAASKLSALPYALSTTAFMMLFRFSLPSGGMGQFARHHPRAPQEQHRISLIQTDAMLLQFNKSAADSRLESVRLETIRRQRAVEPRIKTAA